MSGRSEVRGGPSTFAINNLTALGQTVAGGFLIEAGIRGAQAAAELPGRTFRAGLFQDILIFPSDLTTGVSGNFYMSFKFLKYVKRAISEQKTILDQGTVLLPIPNGLNETTAVSYDNESLGPAIGGAIEGAGVEGFGVQGLQSLVQKLTGGQNLLSGASAVSGLGINPFLTVVFKNPQFKTHTFSWKLIPRDRDESIRLKNIIDTFKYHMLPGLLTSSGVIFEYPEMVQIKLHPNDEFTYKFKPCIIKTLDINYAPSGAPSFVFDSLFPPTAIEIRMSVQEIEYFTKLDYPGTNIQSTGASLPWFPENLSEAAIGALRTGVPLFDIGARLVEQYGPSILGR